MGVTVVNRARIRRDPAAVFDLLANLEREREWNEKLLDVARLTEGPLRTGSRYRARFPWPIGESTITYDAVDAPLGWRTHSTARWLDVQLVGGIADVDGVSHVTLSTTLQPRGPLRLLRRFVADTMKNSWDDHLRKIRHSLEAHDPGEPDHA